MKVYRNIRDFVNVGNAVVTTGTFDGVHKGHRVILDRLADAARRCGGESVVLTFFPHPRMVLQPEVRQMLLSTEQEKLELLEKAGVDHVVIHPFTREFSMLSAREYVEDYLVKGLGVKKLVIGYDHQFGKDRQGSFGNLKLMAPQLGFEVEEIPAQEIDEVKVSSTRVRSALESGNIDLANHLLGYEYSVSGTVVKGDQLGRKLGFPTANIAPQDAYKLVPANGVYAVKVSSRGGSYKGMMNIGFRPTVDGSKRTLEVNIFDFNEEIYGENLVVKFVDRIRDEKKFAGIDELRSAIEKDKVKAGLILSGK